MLRAAFQATMRDKEFLEEAAKAGVDVRPVSGEQIKSIVVEVYAMPPAITEKESQLMSATE